MKLLILLFRHFIEDIFNKKDVKLNGLQSCHFDFFHCIYTVQSQKFTLRDITPYKPKNLSPVEKKSLKYNTLLIPNFRLKSTIW